MHVIGFHCATSTATCVNAKGFKDYKASVMDKLRESPLIDIGGPLPRVCQALPPGNIYLFHLHRIWPPIFCYVSYVAIYFCHRCYF